ncbi:MAG: AmpG family muropeptide MFS transporter [Alphaproteobacteria bacterium]
MRYKIMNISNMKIFKILLLGFSSGLPYALTTSTLNIWLTEVGIEIGVIGLFAAIALPYSFKFIWAPFIDNFDLPYLSRRFGRRLSWMLASQVSLIISIIFLVNTDPTENISLTAFFAVLVVICSATQDISIDGYRIKALQEEEQGLGAALINYGYRVGMLFTSAGALLLSQYYDWSVVYFIAACGVAIGIATVLSIQDLTEEQKNIFQKNIDKKKFNLNLFIKEMIILPWLEFTEKRGWIYIIFFTIFFRLGDSMADVMNNTFYINVGFSKSEIATIAKTFGLIAILIGSFIGGTLVYKLGMIKSLWICGILQMLSNLSFATLATIGYDTDALTIAVAIENLSYGAGATSFVAYLSSLCNSSSFTATHYALLSALASVGRNLLSTPAGYLVEYFGWVNFYIITTVVAIPGLIFLYLICRKYNYSK